jgi:hypothetical protein
MRMLLSVLALAWAVAVAYVAWTFAPQVPLDVSAADPATIDALNAARLRHGLTYGALALVPSALLLWLGRRLAK